MNLTLLAQLLAAIAMTAANPQLGLVSGGVADALNLISAGIKAGTLTDADMQILLARIEAWNVAGGPTVQELSDLQEEVRVKSVQIQSA